MSQDIVNTIEYKGYTIKIYPDYDAENPRDFDDPLSAMFCFHGRYQIGDKHGYSSSQFDGWGEVRDHLVKEEKALLIAELWLYDHSTQHIKIGSWHGLLPGGHAEFDSGMVGFVYTTEKRILSWYGGKKLTKTKMEKAKKQIEGEVELYNSWIEGSCYGYKIDDPDGNEIDDSCWGFYGYKWDENGLREMAENAIDCEIKHREDQAEKERLAKIRKVKALIKNHVPLEVRAAQLT